MGAGWVSSRTGIETERRNSIGCVSCRSLGCIRAVEEVALWRSWSQLVVA